MKAIIQHTIQKFIENPTDVGQFAIGRGVYIMTWDSVEKTVTIMTRPSWDIICEGNNARILAQHIYNHSQK